MMEFKAVPGYKPDRKKLSAGGSLFEWYQPLILTALVLSSLMESVPDWGAYIPMFLIILSSSLTIFCVTVIGIALKFSPSSLEDVDVNPFENKENRLLLLFVGILIMVLSYVNWPIILGIYAFSNFLVVILHTILAIGHKCRHKKS